MPLRSERGTESRTGSETNISGKQTKVTLLTADAGNVFCCFNQRNIKPNTDFIYNLKDSDYGVQHLELLGFLTLSIVRYSKY
jgi:hypothetical protein